MYVGPSVDGLVHRPEEHVILRYPYFDSLSHQEDSDVCQDSLTQNDSTASPYFPGVPTRHETLRESLPKWHRMKNEAKQKCNKVPVLLCMPIMALLVIGIVFIITGPVYVVYTDTNHGSNTQNPTVFLLPNGTQQSTCPGLRSTTSFILVSTIITTIDPSQVAATVKVRTQASYPLIGDIPNSIALPEDATLVVSVASSTEQYVDNGVLREYDVQFPLDFVGPKSSYNYYPSDKYSAELPISIYTKLNGTRSAIPVCVVNFAQVSTFSSTRSYNATIVPLRSLRLFVSRQITTGNFSYVGLQLNFQRDLVTQYFSIFIVTLMWCISGCIFALAIDHVFIRPREPVSATIGFIVSSFFALPALRNTQPGVPPIGAAVDVLGFIWNIALLCLAAVILLSGFLGFYSYEKKKPFYFWGKPGTSF